ncbi:hypothetical protein BGP77_00215 [Saccharospirillum sp. MSK14-1]|uniref:response regulator transcription factor n=1 Tax=Saccharospirillum sp. MSK14-1 TaxID=1897632 RepID=UPI000D427F30|nr:helix-turn-helix transcriptional regulator [Saccharospirillum sp. MSK14-1]PTY35792.1 hypothetical protein BGP77_00215 [Saccharospirillum sp. MSK14-1]
MPLSFDFLVQFFAFSAGFGILLMYGYWQHVRPDARIRWAMLVLVCMMLNYFMGLYTYLLEDLLITGPVSYLHFVVQSLTLFGLIMGVHALLFRLGATPSRIGVAIVWVSLALMAVLNLLSRTLHNSSLLMVSSACFVVAGVWVFYQFWAFVPGSAFVARIRELSLLGLGFLLPAFVLQWLLPPQWMWVHPVDALSYLYVMGCAGWIALDGLFRQNQNTETMADERLDLASAQHRFDLTEREFQVLRLLVQAKPYKTIADELSISAHTVKTHASNVYRKTGTQRKSDLKRRFSRE